MYERGYEGLVAKDEASTYTGGSDALLSGKRRRKPTGQSNNDEPATVHAGTVRQANGGSQ